MPAIIGVKKMLCKIVISADRLPCGIIFKGSNQLCLWWGFSIQELAAIASPFIFRFWIALGFFVELSNISPNIWSTIVSSRVGTPHFLRVPPSPFLVPPSFWSKFKKLPPSFWDPSKLVHTNCKKHFKIKVLRFELN